MTTNTVELHRVFKATPERVYRAFTMVAAWVTWLPPHGFTGTVHEMDARVGGRYRMSFTNFTRTPGETDRDRNQRLAAP